jgi:hypothetical protein
MATDLSVQSADEHVGEDLVRLVFRNGDEVKQSARREEILSLRRAKFCRQYALPLVDRTQTCARARTLTWLSKRFVTVMPRAPPAQVFSIPFTRGSRCAVDASSSSVSTYGGLNTSTSTWVESRSERLEVKSVLMVSIRGCELVCAVTRVDRHAIEFRSVVR